MTNADDKELRDESKKRNILKDKAQKLKSTSKGAVKEGLEKGKKIKTKIEDTTSEVISEIDSKVKQVKNDVQHEITKAAVGGVQMSKSSKSSARGFGSQIEGQIFSWYGYMWSIIAFAFVILISFAISSSDGRFTLLPIILLIAFPFYIFWIIYNAIPEIKIGNRIIFSRDDISIRKQLSFGKAIARTFSREMIKNSPEGAMIIGLFLLLLLYIVLSPIL
ncbi:MAG: hypothetical protein GPJ54_16040 [Candidatus Heimdallarchaeota archaeon]|nr:hypothetical protein [Candidatus Heimdallarchaeota archaeon]